MNGWAYCIVLYIQYKKSKDNQSLIIVQSSRSDPHFGDITSYVSNLFSLLRIVITADFSEILCRLFKDMMRQRHKKVDEGNLGEQYHM